MHTTNHYPHALPIGYQLGHLEIQSIIGQGGFGIIYRALDHQLNRIVAIKEYMPSSIAIRQSDLTIFPLSKQYRAQFNTGMKNFINEAKVLANCAHPNLPVLFNFWRQNGTAYFTTPFYPGMTLKQLQQQFPERITQEWINHLLPKLLAGIDFLHKKGFIHRDIALDNIQILPDDSLILLDFGSASKTPFTSLADEGIVLKPGFAPIEQYTGKHQNQQGPWTDIYAIGAVLHTLIADTPPPVSIVRKIEDSYQPLNERHLPDYTPIFLRAIDQALKLTIEERPQSIQELAYLFNVHSLDEEIPDFASLATVIIPTFTPIETTRWQRFSQAIHQYQQRLNQRIGHAINVTKAKISHFIHNSGYLFKQLKFKISCWYIQLSGKK